MSAAFLIALGLCLLLCWSKVKRLIRSQSPTLAALEVEVIIDDLIAEHNEFFQRGEHTTSVPLKPIEIHQDDVKAYTKCFAHHYITLEHATKRLQEMGYNMQLRLRGNLVPVKVFKQIN